MKQKRLAFGLLMSGLLILAALSIACTPANDSNQTSAMGLPAPEERQRYGCGVQANCVLVQTEWCRLVFAINKDVENEWKEEDGRRTEAKRQNRQTCKVTTREYLDINNFTVSCEQSRCFAKFSNLEGLEAEDDVVPQDTTQRADTVPLE